MEENQKWLEKLQNALSAKQESIETRDLPALKRHFSLYKSYFEGIYNILLKKSLIQEDPYKYDEKITDVTTPPEKDFLESEKHSQMSQRLASYHSNLDFLNSYYQFSLDFLDLGRIKRILSFIDYINWTHLSGPDTNIVSRTLDEFVAKINLGTDSMSSQLLLESFTQLDQVTKQIKLILRDMTSYHREAYKLEVRKRIISHLEAGSAGQENGLQAVRQVFPNYMEGRAFYPELVQEVLDEDFSPQGDELKQGVLRKLAIRQAASKRKSRKVPHKEILLKAVRLMATSGFQLEDVVNKMTDNHLALESRKLNLGGKLRKFFRKLIGRSEENKLYEIAYFDVTTSSNRTESIQYSTFMQDLRKKAKLFTTLANQSSAATQKLVAASEETILQFLNKNISSLQTLHRRLIGFNDYFKNEIPKDKDSRGKFRGLRVELSAVKNSIIKANQAKHEYVTVKEEQDQMKRLGMTQD
jgi:hypothetical protein